MDQKSSQLGGILLLSIGLVAGCASANTASDDVNSDAVVEMVILNRTAATVTAFVEWQNGQRVLLGELRGGATKTFTTPYRGTEIWLSLDFVGRSRSGILGSRERPPSFVPVYPGDRYEWEIRLVSPSVDLFYRRLPAR